jgi:hypothetical protein
MTHWPLTPELLDARRYLLSDYSKKVVALVLLVQVFQIGSKEVHHLLFRVSPINPKF